MGQENLSLLLVTRFGMLYGFLSSLPVHPSQVIAMRAYLIHGNLLGVVSLAGYFCGQAIMLLLPYTPWGSALLGFRFVQSNLFNLTIGLGALVASHRLARESLMAPRLSQTSQLYDPRTLGPGVSSLQDPRAKLYFVLSLLSYLVVPHTPFSVLPRLTNVWSFRYSHQPLWVGGTLLGMLLGHAVFDQVSKFTRAIIEHRARNTYTMLLGRINLALNLLMGVLIGCQVEHLLHPLDPSSIEQSVLSLSKQAALWLEDETSRWFPSSNQSKLSIYGRIVQLEAEKQATEELLLKAMVEEKAYLQRQGHMVPWGERPEAQFSRPGRTPEFERVVADRLRTLHSGDTPSSYKPKRHDRLALALLMAREQGKPSRHKSFANDSSWDTVRQRLATPHLRNQAALLAYCEDVLRYATKMRRASVGWPEPRFYATTQQASLQPRMRLAVSRPLQEDQRDYQLQSQLRRLHLLFFRAPASRAQAHTDSIEAKQDVRIKPSDLAYLLAAGDCESKLSMQAWARLIGRSMVSNPWRGLLSSARHKLSHSVALRLHPSVWHTSLIGHRYVPGQFQFLVTSKWLESLDATSLAPFRTLNLKAQDRAKQVLASIERERIRSMSEEDLRSENSFKRSRTPSSNLKEFLITRTPALDENPKPSDPFYPQVEEVKRGGGVTQHTVNSAVPAFHTTSAALRQPTVHQQVQTAKQRLRNRERAELRGEVDAYSELTSYPASKFQARKTRHVRNSRIAAQLPVSSEHVYVPHLYLMKRALRRLRLAFVDPMSWWSHTHTQSRTERTFHQLSPEFQLLPSTPSDEWRIQTRLKWMKKAMAKRSNFIRKNLPKPTTFTTPSDDLGVEVQAVTGTHADGGSSTSLHTHVTSSLDRVGSGTLSHEQGALLPVFRLRKRLSGSLAIPRLRAHRNLMFKVPKHSMWDVWRKRPAPNGHKAELGVDARKKDVRLMMQLKLLSGQAPYGSPPSLLSLFKRHPELNRIKTGIRYLRMLERRKLRVRFFSRDNALYGRSRSEVQQNESIYRNFELLPQLKDKPVLRILYNLYYQTSHWISSRVSAYFGSIQNVSNVLLTPVGSRKGAAKYTVCFVVFGKPHKIYQPSGQYMTRQVEGWMDAIWFQNAERIAEWRPQIAHVRQVSWTDVSPLLGDGQRSVFLADKMVAVRIDSVGEWVRLMMRAFLRNPVAALLEAQLQFIPLDRAKYQWLFGGHNRIGASLAEQADEAESQVQRQPEAGPGVLLQREHDASLDDENSSFNLQQHYQALRAARRRVTNRLWMGLGFSSPPYLAESVLNALGVSTRIPTPLLVKSFASLKHQLGYERQRWFDKQHLSWPFCMEFVLKTAGAAPNLPWWVGIDLTGFERRIVRADANKYRSHRSYFNPHLALTTSSIRDYLQNSSADLPDAQSTKRRIERLVALLGPSFRQDLYNKAASLQSSELNTKQEAWIRRIYQAAEGLPVYRNPAQFALPALSEHFDPSFYASYTHVSAQPSKHTARLARQARYNRLWEDIIGAHASFQQLQPATDWKRAIQSLSTIQLPFDTDLQLKRVANQLRVSHTSGDALQLYTHTVSTPDAPTLPSDKRYLAGMIRLIKRLRPNQFWLGGLSPRDKATRLKLKQDRRSAFSRRCLQARFSNTRALDAPNIDAITGKRIKTRQPLNKLGRNDPQSDQHEWPQDEPEWNFEAADRAERVVARAMKRRRRKMWAPTRKSALQLLGGKKPTVMKQFQQLATPRQDLTTTRSQLHLFRFNRRNRLRPIQKKAMLEIRAWINRLDRAESRVLKFGPSRAAFRDEMLEQAQFQPSKSTNSLQPFIKPQPPQFDPTLRIESSKQKVKRAFAGRKRRALGLAQREWIYKHYDSNSSVLLCKIGHRLPRVTRLDPFASQQLDRVALGESTVSLHEQLSITETDTYMRPSGLLTTLLQTQMDYPFDGLPESFIERSMYALRPWHYTKSFWRVKDAYPPTGSQSILARAGKPLAVWMNRVGLGELWTKLIDLWQSMLRILFRSNG